MMIWIEADINEALEAQVPIQDKTKMQIVDDMLRPSLIPETIEKED